MMVIELFREGRISSGTGADLLHIPLWDFVQLLASHNTNDFSQTPEDLDVELDTLDTLADAVMP